MLKYILISFLIITNVYAYTCEEMGYTQTIEDCPDHGLRCPAEPEKMFCCDPCGNRGVFRFDESNCSPDDGLQLSGIDCKGKWSECRQCTSEYKYNKDNCRSPKILAGVQCGNAYTQCVYPSGIGCVPTVGYIYYADDSCHAEHDDTKVPIGIIVDAVRKIMIAIDEEKHPWNDGTDDFKNVTDLVDYGQPSGALLHMDGFESTDKIVKFALSSGQEHKAAQYCVEKNTGNKDWYLPALGEFSEMYNKISDINAALENIQKNAKFSSYSTSTERNRSDIRTYNLSNGEQGIASKKSSVLVRCFAHF